MKVKELIKFLLECDPSAEVILQKDGEGNGYSPLADADHQVIYVPETTWYGSVYSTQWTADAAGMDEAEWQAFLKKKRCVVLCPTN